MSFEQFYYGAEIVAAIAFVTSLIYVARQIGQNTDAVQSSVRQSMLEADRDLMRLMVEHPSLSKRVDLSVGEEVQLQAFLIAFIRARENYYVQYKSGVLDEDTYISYRGPLIKVVFSSKYGRAFWSGPRVTSIMNKNFIKNINQWIEGMDLPDETEQFQSIQEACREE